MRRTAVALAATMATLGAPVAAQAHGGDADPGPLAHASARSLDRAEDARLAKITNRKARRREKKVYSLESATLGPRHATEHAELRALRRLAETRAGRARIARAKRRAIRAYREAFPEPRRLMAEGAPDVLGQWERQAGGATVKLDLPVYGINAILLPTGKVMIYAYPLGTRPKLDPQDNWSKAFLWTPGTNNFEEVDPPVDPETGKTANIWCSGNNLLPSGELLVTGGNLGYLDDKTYYRGLKSVYTFNPWNQKWTYQGKMEHGRWYPTQTQLPDGRVLIFSGIDEYGDRVHTNIDVEMFTPSPTLGGKGTITKVARQPYDSTGLYPHTFVMGTGPAAGNVLLAGPWNVDSGLVSTTDFTWEGLVNGPGQRYGGNGVYVPAPAGQPPHEALLLGGTDYSWHVGDSKEVVNPKPRVPNDPAADAEAQAYNAKLVTHPVKTGTYLDFNDPRSGWKPDADFNVARAHANTVLLPDGTMVMVGGGVGDSGPDAPGSVQQWLATPEHKQVEIRSPLDGKWTLGPAQDESRAYHSVALMLPDGRVMSAGDDWNGGTTKDSAEFYRPAYLFKGPRPSIQSAADEVPYGSRFTIKASPDATRAVLMAPSAVTHANDMNQNRLELAVRPVAGGLSAVAPANAAQAVPGYYMLFVLNDKGVPSMAEWVHLGFGSPEPDPTPTPTPTATPTPSATPTPTATPTPQPKPPVVLRITRTQARSQAARALQTRSRSYRKGTRRRIACTVSRAVGTCSATWRYRSRARHARVRVTMTSTTTFRVAIR